METKGKEASKGLYESEDMRFFKVALNADKRLQGKEHDNGAIEGTFRELVMVVNASRASLDFSHEMLFELAGEQPSLTEHIKVFNASNAVKLCGEQVEAIEKCLKRCAEIYEDLRIKELKKN